MGPIVEFTCKHKNLRQSNWCCILNFSWVTPRKFSILFKMWGTFEKDIKFKEGDIKFTFYVDDFNEMFLGFWNFHKCKNC